MALLRGFLTPDGAPFEFDWYFFLVSCLGCVEADKTGAVCHFISETDLCFIETLWRIKFNRKCYAGSFQQVVLYIKLFLSGTNHFPLDNSGEQWQGSPSGLTPLFLFLFCFLMLISPIITDTFINHLLIH